MGYGFASFFCFGVLEQLWPSAVPQHPNEAFGLIYRHNQHGSYTYFLQFQTTACALMFTTSIPLVFAGMLIAPKRAAVGGGRIAANFKWDNQHPGVIAKWSAIAGAAPVFVYFVGPFIVKRLNAAGFMINFG